MITKKWVEERIVEVEGKAKREIREARERAYKDLVVHTESFQKVVNGLRADLGYSNPDNPDYPGKPSIPVAQRLDAICSYLGIEIVMEAKEEKIVAKKIKKAK